MAVKQAIPDNIAHLSTGYVPDRKLGRPKKLTMPLLPRELMESMNDLEKEWFEFFRDAYLKDYPDMSATDQICLLQAALEQVHVLRKHCVLLGTDSMLPIAKQDPSVTLLRWLDMMDCTRKARRRNAKDVDPNDETKAEMTRLLRGLSS